MSGFSLNKTADEKYYLITFNGHGSIKNCGDNYRSSFHIIGSRLLGLNYDDYLTFCQSKGAKLRGRSGYCYPIWKDRAAAQGVLNIIQKEWERLEAFLNQNN